MNENEKYIKNLYNEVNNTINELILLLNLIKESKKCESYDENIIIQKKIIDFLNNINIEFTKMDTEKEML